MMPVNKKMSSRELGLVLAQQILDVEDLHYGLWDPDLEVSLGNIALAQQRYTELLLGKIDALLAGHPAPRILDVGCGTGHMLQLMVERGYAVDAVNPSAQLNRQVRARLAAMQHTDSTLFESDFESLPLATCQHRYDLLLFSESFQYIPLPEIFEKCPLLLKPGGQVLLCDFFKTDAHCDVAEGDRSFSGGHLLGPFYEHVSAAPFTLLHDEDLTARVSPNIALLDEWLTQRLLPASRSIDQFLLSRYPRLTRLTKWLARHKLDRLRYKYFSGHRSQAVFEKYKSYRLLVLQLD
jgi:SAM-dependent methyltransferase